uniref:Uncharacterized protein n=1 Tax=Arundo donax TaxID=35708 RepID=A0A0A9CQT1_ARUDO
MVQCVFVKKIWLRKLVTFIIHHFLLVPQLIAKGNKYELF